MLSTTALWRRTQPIKGNLGIAVAIVAVLLFALSLAQTAAGRSVLRAAGLYRGSSAYTSLAFSNPQSLPPRLSTTHTKLAVSFVIGNVSTTPHRYQWSVFLNHGGHASRLAAGGTQVPSGGSATVSRRVTVSCSSGRARVVVKLADPAESIDFWAACTP
jgi:hypothetical protein